MTREKKGPRLEVLVDTECLFLRGTGVDLEPALLSGQVSLHLSKPTSIKEITLRFRGKARLPISSPDSLNDLHATYMICNHEWSFLEGEGKHSRTLKAGRHLFPFRLLLGGSLPSTVTTSAMGGASVSYKLRAHVSRPGLSYNLSAVTPIYIIRSFSSEALEYQQTLEIENTWPNKLMYSIMVPHKAWAVGDTLTALVKCSPLVKGVRVPCITTRIVETTRTEVGSGDRGIERVVGRFKHDIVDGAAVLNSASLSIGSPLNPSGSPSTGGPPPAANSASILEENRDPNSAAAEGAEEPSHDLTLRLSIPVPPTLTPSHRTQPIVICHQIRWSVSIANLDGHISELRCSLPIHVLDSALLNESRTFTAAARRILLGEMEVPSEDEEALELPSYSAHVRDRVANMYLSDSAMVRIANPLLSGGGSHSTFELSGSAMETSRPSTSSTSSSTRDEPRTCLDWLHCELLLSQSHEPPSTTSLCHHSSASDSAENGNHRQEPQDPGRTTRLNQLASPIEETHLHSNTQASRSLPHLLRIGIKRFTPNLFPTWSHVRSPPMLTIHQQQEQQASHQERPGQPAMTSSIDRELGRALNRVPEYEIAARGFIGGVPPLSSMSGLPSYAESGGSLASCERLSFNHLAQMSSVMATA